MLRSVCACLVGNKNKIKKHLLATLRWLQFLKNRMADTAEALKPLIEALAHRFDRLESLVEGVRQQQKISEASFEELQAWFDRATVQESKPVKATNLSVERIIEYLRSREARTKARDLHEIEALADIIDAKSAEQVFTIVSNRLCDLHCDHERVARSASLCAQGLRGSDRGSQHSRRTHHPTDSFKQRTSSCTVQTAKGLINMRRTWTGCRQVHRWDLLSWRRRPELQWQLSHIWCRMWALGVIAPCRCFLLI